MKKITAVVLLSAFVAAPALADYDGVADKVGTVHAGAKLGFTNYVNSPMGFGIYGGYTVVGPNTFKGNPFFSKISIAVEGEYVSLGSTSYTSGDYRADAMGVAAAATYPINRQFSATAKAGLSRTTNKYTDKTNSVFNYSHSYFGLHGGIAGQYHLNQKIGFLAAFDFYPNGYDMTSVSAMYKF